MYPFEECARPILFEHDGKYSYWGKGSSVLLASKKNFYFVTARHVISNLGGQIESLRIFPADDSRISLPFNEKYIIQYRPHNRQLSPKAWKTILSCSFSTLASFLIVGLTAPDSGMSSIFRIAQILRS